MTESTNQSKNSKDCPFCKKLENPCAFCEKVGLPVLPIRYAVARADMGIAPQLSAPFGAGISDIELPSKDAHYTLRLLREGYLYVFNEKRGEWCVYAVTRDGYLFKFDINAKAAPNTDNLTFSCSRPGDAYLARCVCIPDADKAGNVWFGFSDVLWTPDVRARHDKEEYRKQHMRCVDVSKWLEGKGQPHAAPFEDIAKRVADYAVSASQPTVANNQSSTRQPGLLPEVVITAYRAMGYSPFNFNGLGQDVSGLLEWAGRSCDIHKPMLLGVTDAVGIAADIARLMQIRTRAFINNIKVDKDRARKLAISGVISQMRDAIKNQAELSEIEAGDKLASDAEYGVTTSFGGIGGGMAMPQPELAKRYRDMLTPEHLQKVGDDEWLKYTEKYDEGARVKFQSEFDKDLANFDAQTIFPLANAHVAWMSCNHLKHQFACNTDPANIWSGLGYLQMLLLCIDNTADKKPCADLYEKWLALNETLDQNNIILRALMLNQDNLAKPISEAAKGALDSRSIPWDNLISVYKSAVEQLAEGHRHFINDYIVQLGGPLSKIGNRIIDAGKGAGMAALVSLGVLQERAIVRVSVTGSKKAFRAMLIRQLMKAYGSKLPQRDMERAVSTELRRMQINGARLDGTDKKNWLLMVDGANVKGMPANLSSQEQANWLASSLRTAEQLEAATSRGWRAVMNTSVRIGIVSGFLQAWCLTKLIDDEASAMSNERKESIWRMYAGVGAFTGTLCEVAAKGLEGVAHLPSISARAASFLSWRPFLEGAGRFAGAAAGAVMAVWDGIKSVENFSEGNKAMGWLYAGSGLLGVAITLGFLFSWAGPIMLLLVAAFVIVAVLIELFKDNKLMEWLKRSFWGVLKDERYSEEDEKAQLELALKG